jgi:hypothetical protein
LEFEFQSFLITHYPRRKKVVDRKNKTKNPCSKTIRKKLLGLFFFSSSISLTSSAVEPSLTAQLTKSLLFKNQVKRLQEQRSRT